MGSTRSLVLAGLVAGLTTAVPVGAARALTLGPLVEAFASAPSTSAGGEIAVDRVLGETDLGVTLGESQPKPAPSTDGSVLLSNDPEAGFGFEPSLPIPRLDAGH